MLPWANNPFGVSGGGGGKFTGTKQFLQYTLKSAGNSRGQQMVPHCCDKINL